jgi:large subunit ribosomal protein L21
MFAVIKTGGKQYKITPGQFIRVEKLAGAPGDKVTLDNILMVSTSDETQVGTPLLEGHTIKATILEQTRNDKIVIYKKRRRQGYDRKKGHRQEVSVIYVDEIVANGKTLAKADKPAPLKSAAPVEAKASKAKPAVEASAPEAVAQEEAAPKAKKATSTKKKEAKE